MSCNVGGVTWKLASSGHLLLHMVLGPLRVIFRAEQWDFFHGDLELCEQLSQDKKQKLQCLKTWALKLVQCYFHHILLVRVIKSLRRHCGEDLDPTLNGKRVWVSVQECMAIVNLPQNYFIRFSPKSCWSVHCNFVMFIDESVICSPIIFSQLGMAI